MITIMAALLIFGTIHSGLAGQNVKQAVRRRVGERAYEGGYRLGYNLLAIVTLAPVFALILLQPGSIIWRVEGWLALGLGLIQVAGAIGILFSFLQIDAMRFIGLAQLRAYFAGDKLPLPDEPLQEKGVYAWVRHPLYLFSLMLIWPLTPMTEGLLAFNIATTLYFVVGSLLEERRLIAVYGDTYRQYQRRVAWLIPGTRIRL